MSDLPFPLIAGDALHWVVGSEVAARLLATARQPATCAEILVASLRAWGSPAVYFHEGNGAFDVYEWGDSIRGIDVKNRSSNFANDLDGWINTINQLDVDAKANAPLEAWIEQIVTDELGRRTWLLFPGIIPQSRAFVARGRMTISEQLDRFIQKRLDLKGGTVLLRDLPVSVYTRWESNEVTFAPYARTYQRRLVAYHGQERVQIMARQVAAQDRTRVQKLNFAGFKIFAENMIERGEDNETTRLFLGHARAEQEAARADTLAKLARELDIGLKAGDLEAVQRISTAMNSVPRP